LTSGVPRVKASTTEYSFNGVDIEWWFEKVLIPKLLELYGKRVAVVIDNATAHFRNVSGRSRSKVIASRTKPRCWSP
jgi:hypothetical protein